MVKSLSRTRPGRLFSKVLFLSAPLILLLIFFLLNHFLGFSPFVQVPDTSETAGFYTIYIDGFTAQPLALPLQNAASLTLVSVSENASEVFLSCRNAQGEETSSSPALRENGIYRLPPKAEEKDRVFISASGEEISAENPASVILLMDPPVKRLS